MREYYLSLSVSLLRSPRPVLCHLMSFAIKPQRLWDERRFQADQRYLVNWPLFVCSQFCNRIRTDLDNNSRFHNEHINSGNNAAASFKNLVNFGPVTPEITFICVLVPLYGLGAKIGLRSLFVALELPDVLED